MVFGFKSRKERLLKKEKDIEQKVYASKIKYTKEQELAEIKTRINKKRGLKNKLDSKRNAKKYSNAKKSFERVGSFAAKYTQLASERLEKAPGIRGDYIGGPKKRKKKEKNPFDFF